MMRSQTKKGLLQQLCRLLVLVCLFSVVVSVSSSLANDGWGRFQGVSDDIKGSLGSKSAVDDDSQQAIDDMIQSVVNKAKIGINDSMQITGGDILQLSCSESPIKSIFDENQEVWSNMRNMGGIGAVLKQVGNTLKDAAMRDILSNIGKRACNQLADLVNRQLQQCFSFNLNVALNLPRFRPFRQCLMQAKAQVAYNNFNYRMDTSYATAKNVTVADLLGLSQYQDFFSQDFYEDVWSSTVETAYESEIEFEACKPTSKAIATIFTEDFIKQLNDSMSANVDEYGDELIVGENSVDLSWIERDADGRFAITEEYMYNFTKQSDIDGIEDRLECYGFERSTYSPCGYETVDTDNDGIADFKRPKSCDGIIVNKACCDLAENDCQATGLPACPCTEGNLGAFENGECLAGVVSCCNSELNDCESEEYIGFPVCEVEYAEADYCRRPSRAASTDLYGEPELNRDGTPSDPLDQRQFYDVWDYLVVRPDGVVDGEACCTTPWCNLCPQHVMAAYFLNRGEIYLPNETNYYTAGFESLGEIDPVAIGIAGNEYLQSRPKGDLTFELNFDPYKNGKAVLPGVSEKAIRYYKGNPFFSYRPVGVDELMYITSNIPAHCLNSSSANNNLQKGMILTGSEVVYDKTVYFPTDNFDYYILGVDDEGNPMDISKVVALLERWGQQDLATQISGGLPYGYNARLAQLGYPISKQIPYEDENGFVSQTSLPLCSDLNICLPEDHTLFHYQNFSDQEIQRQIDKGIYEPYPFLNDNSSSSADEADEPKDRPDVSSDPIKGGTELEDDSLPDKDQIDTNGANGGFIAPNKDEETSTDWWY